MVIIVIIAIMVRIRMIKVNNNMRSIRVNMIFKLEDWIIKIIIVINIIATIIIRNSLWKIIIIIFKKNIILCKNL